MKPYGIKDVKTKVCSCCVSEAKSEKHRANRSAARQKAKKEMKKCLLDSTYSDK